MDHRSSLPDFFANRKIDRALQGDKDATWTAARAWKYVPKVRPKPGTIYDYSNTNYLLLGELVEHVTNNPLATEVRTRLLDPLQLTTAWYQAVEEPKAKGARGYRLTRTASGALLKPVAAPVGRHAVPLGRDRRGRRGVDRRHRDGRGALDAGVGLGQPAVTRDVPRDAPRREVHPGDARDRDLRPGGPADLDPGPADARPLGSLPRLPERGPLPARPGDLDRDPDQPEHLRPGGADAPPGQDRGPGQAAGVPGTGGPMPASRRSSRSGRGLQDPEIASCGPSSASSPIASDADRWSPCGGSAVKGTTDPLGRVPDGWSHGP